MNSSISSSDRSDTPVQPRSERHFYGRVMLAIGLGMLAALGLVRGFTEALGGRPESFMARVTQAMDALPRIIAEDGELVLFYGSSMVEAGFSPRVFDRLLEERGIDVKSFNFGFGGLNPFFQDYLSRRIVEEFEDAERRLEMVIIEFNPFQTTTARWQGAQPIVDTYLTILANDRELLDVFLDDPERGVRLFTIRYLRNNISAETVTWFLGQGLQARPRGTDLEPDEAVQERLEEIGGVLSERFEEDYPEFDDDIAWNWDWQGGGTIPAERSADTRELFVEYYELLRNDYRMDNDLIRRIRTADIVELNFEPVLVEAFINIVNNFKRIADDVVIVMLPKNTDWIDNPPDALERQRRVVERIERETGVAVRDWQVTDRITPEMFGDTTHLGRYIGDVPFTRMLADRLAGELDDG